EDERCHVGGVRRPFRQLEELACLVKPAFEAEDARQLSRMGRQVAGFAERLQPQTALAVEPLRGGEVAGPLLEVAGHERAAVVPDEEAELEVDAACALEESAPLFEIAAHAEERSLSQQLARLGERPAGVRGRSGERDADRRRSEMLDSTHPEERFAFEPPVARQASALEDVLRRLAHLSVA